MKKYLLIVIITLIVLRISAQQVIPLYPEKSESNTEKITYTTDFHILPI